MADQDKPKVAVIKTPQGQYVTEAPEITTPGVQHNLFGYWGTWLGNPYERYGYLVSSLNIPINTKLEMMKDNVLALCIAFTGTTLVDAKWEVACADEDKRRFFEALLRSWRDKFILQANVGIALGSLGLVKKWRFETPQPIGMDELPVWRGDSTPYVITGFDMLYPQGSSPEFDPKGHHFQGMQTPDGKVDVFHSLWLTFRQELAFGGYHGVGRLEHCYKNWWLKNFGADLYVVALQKQADRVIEARYPPGKDKKTGKDNQTIALEVGDSVRSGATVAIPSDVYITDTLDGEERPTSVRRWELNFLEGAGQMGGFHEIDNHHDKKMALGYFLPPQALLEVTGGQLGSVSSAEVLTGIAAKLLMQDAADIDTHLNTYVLPAISKANFPPTSPRVLVKTTGLDRVSLDALLEVVKGLIGQHPDAKYFDMRAAMERLEFPLKSEEEVEAEQQAAEANQASPPTETPETAAIGAAVDEAGHVQVQGAPLPAWPDDEDVPLSDRDAEVAVSWWRDFAPDGANGLLDATTETGDVIEVSTKDSQDAN